MRLEYSNASISQIEVDALLVGRFQDESLSLGLGELLGDAVSDLLADMTGKSSDQVAIFYPNGLLAARRLLIVGLGKREKVTLETLRRATAKGMAKAKGLGAAAVATTLGQVEGKGARKAEASHAVTLAAHLTLYDYSLKKKSDKQPAKRVERLILMGAEAEEQAAAALGEAIASGVMQARDLVNAPPNIADAPYLANVAREIAASSPHINVTVLSLEEAREMGMGAFAGVGQGSATPPQFIVLEYRTEELSDAQPVGLVGKGLIFDTGGINLKTSSTIWKMKTDMSGGAAVLGTFRALANLPQALELPVVGVVPATDNAIGHTSMLPSDVLTAMNGKTIEILNTDAEGRLILADALTYIERYQPRAVVDLATLTGAISVALGRNMSGLFSNDDDLAQRLAQAAQQSGEELWRLPLYEEYETLIESKIANLKNTAGRYGGAIGAALFLQHFIGSYPWAHLDIAGTAWGQDRTNKLPYNKKGASGVGVRLLMELLRGYVGCEA